MIITRTQDTWIFNIFILDMLPTQHLGIWGEGHNWNNYNDIITRLYSSNTFKISGMSTFHSITAFHTLIQPTYRSTSIYQEDNHHSAVKNSFSSAETKGSSPCSCSLKLMPILSHINKVHAHTSHSFKIKTSYYSAIYNDVSHVIPSLQIFFWVIFCYKLKYLPNMFQHPLIPFSLTSPIISNKKNKFWSPSLCSLLQHLVTPSHVQYFPQQSALK
jgi:hypothetical protein